LDDGWEIATEQVLVGLCQALCYRACSSATDVVTYASAVLALLSADAIAHMLSCQARGLCICGNVAIVMHWEYWCRPVSAAQQEQQLQTEEWIRASG